MSTDGGKTAALLEFPCIFHDPNAGDPYDVIKWDIRTAEITDSKGGVAFKRENVRVPSAWSQLALNVVASKYFYGSPGEPKAENDVGALIRRVTRTIANWGVKLGYFSKDMGVVFEHELRMLCINQYASFNSPVWFNCGLFQELHVEGDSQGGYYYDLEKGRAVRAPNHYEYPQCSACFIQSVEDNMESIMGLAVSEAMLFKYGSGTGTDLTPIRSFRETLAGGGIPSGPLSFLGIYDKIANVVKSGGKCLAGGQPVMTERGVQLAEKLADTRFITLSYDPPAGRIKAKWATCWKSGQKPVVRVVTDKGEFDVSEDHPFLLAGTRETCEARNLQVGQRLFAASLVERSDNYIHIHQPVDTENTRMLMHRLVVQDIMGLSLDDLVVHHKDGDAGNNHPDNLQVMTQSAHAAMHGIKQAAAGTHVFQHNTYSHSGSENGMYRTSKFWHDKKIVNDYVQCQRQALVQRGTAHDMQMMAARQRMMNTAWTLLNAGCTIDNWEQYKTAREQHIGRIGDPRKVLNSINQRFGSYEAFMDAVNESNHKVLQIVQAGVQDVYSVEVECPTEDDKTPDSGHNYMLISHCNSGVSGAGVFVSNTRRAAKMNSLQIWHPDIMEFIKAKANEERKAQALIKAGWDGSFNGEAYSTVAYQNENLSLYLSDAFMHAVEKDKPWQTRWVTDTKKHGPEYPARDVLKAIAESAHFCGDPGVQFDDTINRWHTCKNDGRISASNPCSEYMFLPNSACNLASINLMKFRREDGTFDCARFSAAVRLLITAQDILVDMSSYPTAQIARNSHMYRPLGLGYANLGAYLMSLGLPYDSDAGRNVAAAITALLHFEAYCQSSKLAVVKGTFERYEQNKESMLDVINQHNVAWCDVNTATLVDLDPGMANAINDACTRLTEWQKYGFRNAQVTVLAPTGTIGFMMDCDTTGVEPNIGLVTYKQLAAAQPGEKGGVLKLVNRTVSMALKRLGYMEDAVEVIRNYIDTHDTIEGAPPLEDEDLRVFDCALKPKNGKRFIPYEAHLKMMAAVQPFLSGAISKTVNVPEATTVDDIAMIYHHAWKMGLKAVAIYRDNSKRSQPVTMSKTTEVKAVEKAKDPRERLPHTRNAIIHKFEIGNHDGYVTLGFYDDDRLGEIFVTMAKEGSTIRGLMDCWATAVSIGLQYGVPFNVFKNKFEHTRFEPSGWCNGGSPIKTCSSLPDYIFRWVDLYLQDKSGAVTPVPDVIEQEVKPVSAGAVISAANAELSPDAPPCDKCGAISVRSGTCFKCTNCGNSLGCS